MTKNQNNSKTALITGSSKGLGAVLARSLLNSGYNVVINYSKSHSKAKQLSKKLNQNRKVLTIRGDVKIFSNAKSVVKQTIDKFGSVDILVNNAGIHIDHSVIKMTESSWKKVIETNLTGTFNFCKAVLPNMKKNEFGRIINVSSFTAFTGIAGASNYSASKAGIIAFTKSLSKEVAKNGITVNAIAPGYFDIGLFYDFTKEQRKKIVDEIPAKRLGNPEEISELVKILISSSYITGQTFVIDGGYSA